MTHNYILKGMLVVVLLFTTSVSLAQDPGDQILEDKCTMCHDKPDPAKLTKEEWVIKVDEMAPNAGLSSAETSKVLDYVSSHAKGAAAVLSMVNEKRLFDEKCSLCHTTNRALIMPMTLDSVREIVSRMQTIAGSWFMSGDWITNDQANEISEYLVHGAPESTRPKRSELKTSDPYEMFLQRCTACHTAEKIFVRLESDREGKTVTKWAEIVNEMQKKAPDWIIKPEAKTITSFLSGLSKK